MSINSNINLNANFTDRALVHISFSDNFMSLSTFSALHGKSGSFLVSINRLTSFIISADDTFYDADCGSFLSITRTGSGDFRFCINWIDHHSDDTITGYRQRFILSESVFTELILYRTRRTLLVSTHQQHSSVHIVLTDSAHRLIAALSKPERRAFIKALCAHFQYGRDDTVFLYADYDHSFFFRDDSLCGGLVPHTNTVIGSDGQLHTRIRYTMHT